jgi:hypothetical protein
MEINDYNNMMLNPEFFVIKFSINYPVLSACLVVIFTHIEVPAYHCLAGLDKVGMIPGRHFVDTNELNFAKGAEYLLKYTKEPEEGGVPFITAILPVAYKKCFIPVYNG